MLKEKLTFWMFPETFPRKLSGPRNPRKLTTLWGIIGCVTVVLLFFVFVCIGDYICVGEAMHKMIPLLKQLTLSVEDIWGSEYHPPPPLKAPPLIGLLAPGSMGIFDLEKFCDLFPW